MLDLHADAELLVRIRLVIKNRNLHYCEEHVLEYNTHYNPFSFIFFLVQTEIGLPRWLRRLRHSAHRTGRSIEAAGVQFPGSAGRYCVRFTGAHALRLISRAGRCPL